jgi:hypothetical protein
MVHGDESNEVIDVLHVIGVLVFFGVSLLLLF